MGSLAGGSKVEVVGGGYGGASPLPPMRAGEIAVKPGLATANKREREVGFLTFESKAAKNIHVASVHRYAAAQKTMLTVAGSGGVSSAASELEGRYAMGWARNIWADTLA